MNYIEKQAEFDHRAEMYLVELTKVQSVEDLLKVVRDAAEWALFAHRREVAEKKQRRMERKP